MSDTATLYNFKTLNEETGHRGSDLYVVAENLVGAARVAEQSVDPGYRISAAEEYLECVLVAPEINQAERRFDVPEKFRELVRKSNLDEVPGRHTDLYPPVTASTHGLDDVGERHPFLDDGDPDLHAGKVREFLGGDDVYRAEKEELAAREGRPLFLNPDRGDSQGNDCSETFEDEPTSIREARDPVERKRPIGGLSMRERPVTQRDADNGQPGSHHDVTPGEVLIREDT